LNKNAVENLLLKKHAVNKNTVEKYDVENHRGNRDVLWHRQAAEKSAKTPMDEVRIARRGR
jgi:hypothetical protein